MAINPCTKFTRCDCSPGVFRTNFSAEQPDPAEFFAIVFDQIIPHLGDPDTYWTNIAQPGVCTAPTLQEAQDCARRQGNDAIVENWIDPHRNPVVLFGNAQQSCSIPCPTGPPYIYTVEAGTFTARTQEEADTLAASYCFSRGMKVRQCNPVVPVVPPSIEVVDLNILWDLAPNAGNLVGQTLAGEAGWFNNGGVTVLTFAGGEAFATNDFGDVAGDFNSGPNTNAFWYDGIFRDLGTSAFGNATMHGLSADGFSVYQDSTAAVASFLYNPILSTFTNLGFFGGGDNTVAGDSLSGAPLPQRKIINASHQITGTMRDAAFDRHAFRWSGALVDITPLAGFPTPQASGIHIDDTGAVMGNYINIPLGTLPRVFLNLSGGSVNSNDIGGVGNRYVVGYSMSNQNQFICGICDDGTPNSAAFLWDSINGFRTLPVVTGGIAPNGSYDCNSHSDVVGFSNNFIAWLYRNGIVYKLLDILNAWSLDPLWTSLRTAELINDSRQIAGFGIHGGIAKAYLFTIPDGAELGPPPP